MSRVIEPSPGVVLAELAESDFGNIPVPPKDHNSLTWATVKTVHPSDAEAHGYLIDRQIHFRKYKDDARVLGTPFVLIEIADILGSSYEQ